MSARTTSSHTFTKLIVGDPEKMAAFYKEVYGLEEIERIQSAIGPDPIDEIMLGILLMRVTNGDPTKKLIIEKTIGKRSE